MTLFMLRGMPRDLGLNSGPRRRIGCTIINAELVIEDEHSAVKVDFRIETARRFPDEPRPEKPPGGDDRACRIVQGKGEGIEGPLVLQFITPTEPIGEPGPRLGAEPTQRETAGEGFIFRKMIGDRIDRVGVEGAPSTAEQGPAPALGCIEFRVAGHHTPQKTGGTTTGRHPPAF